MSVQAFLPRKVADSSIISYCGCTTLGLSTIQGQKLLTLHWCSLLGCGNKHDACLFSYNADQYIYFGRMWQFSPLIAKGVWLIIIDTPLTPAWNTSKRSFYTQLFYTTNCIVIIDSQYGLSLYNRLHAEALWSLNYWSTTIHIIWVMHGMALLHSRRFGQQFMSFGSFY